MHNLQVSDGDNGLMLLRDQIVIQIGEEVDGMVMIRSADNRQGICPAKFLQDVWQHNAVAPHLATPYSTPLNSQIVPQPVLKKVYYTNPKPIIQNNISNKQMNKNNINSSNLLQYYYNNFTKRSKNTNVYNNVLNRRRTELAFLHGKAPFSSTKRPLSIRLSTPKHVVNFFQKSFKSDSQKRPLILQESNTSLLRMPDFQIIPNKSGLKISSIYTISENVEKLSLYRKNLYISSNSRPLFVRL